MRTAVSPETWSAELLTRFTNLNQIFGQAWLAAKGNAFMVAGTSGALSVRPGFGALQQGSRLSLEDLARHEAVWRAPLHTSYRGNKVYAPAPPVISGQHLLEALNLLDQIDLLFFSAIRKSNSP